MSKNCCLPKNPIEDIGYLIWRISKIWQRGRQKTLEEFDLTPPQLEILGAIYHMSNLKMKTTQIVLSQETDIDPMTTSTILRNLQKKGLVNRKESETDTRARIVETTDKGAEIFTKAILKVKESQDILLENLDKEALKIQLQNLLREMDRINQTHYLNN